MFTSVLSLLGLVMLAEPAAIGAGACAPRADSPPITSDLDPIEFDFSIDARLFFEQLVNRYRNLAVYRDVTRVVQITRHNDDDPPTRIETKFNCDITDGQVRIETAGSQIARGLGLAVPMRVSDEFKSAQRRYELWLLPHLTLKLSDEPLRDFREGVIEGFTATDAAAVTLDNRPMVHLELKSGDGLSEDCNARFDLFVDPDSMLIERIQGEQRLPDGGRYETSLDIEPSHVETRTRDDAPTWPETQSNETNPTFNDSAWPETPRTDAAKAEPAIVCDPDAKRSNAPNASGEAGDKPEPSPAAPRGGSTTKTPPAKSDGAPASTPPAHSCDPSQ